MKSSWPVTQLRGLLHTKLEETQICMQRNARMQEGKENKPDEAKPDKKNQEKKE